MRAHGVRRARARYRDWVVHGEDALVPYTIRIVPCLHPRGAEVVITDDDTGEVSTLWADGEDAANEIVAALRLAGLKEEG